MTRDELWELLHKKMIDKLEEVLPIINEDSDRFIDLDWSDATGEFHDEWIRTMLVNIHSEQRMDEVIQLIASCYHRMYMNGERAAYGNNMPEYGVPKHRDIMGLMKKCKQEEIARRKANQDDEDLKAQMHNKYKKAANEHNEKSSEINKQLVKCFRSYLTCSKRSLVTEEDFREHQANVFAAAIAMPRATFVPYAKRLLMQYGLEGRFSPVCGGQQVFPGYI